MLMKRKGKYFSPIVAIFLCAIIFIGGIKYNPFISWQYLPKSSADITKIYVIDHGWHTGIIVSRDDLDSYSGVIKDDFFDTQYYELGWGDEGFYQSQEITVGLAAKAIFWPTDSVMHIVSIPDEPYTYYLTSEIIEVNISTDGLKKMIAAVEGSFERDNEGFAIKTDIGRYGQSYFYKGIGQYYITNTCNSWTAAMLSQAGLPISTFLTLTSGSVMDQVKDAVDDFNDYELSESNL